MWDARRSRTNGGADVVCGHLARGAILETRFPSDFLPLRGNACENGAVIKPSAASPHLMQHTGKALVSKTSKTTKTASTVQTSTSTKTVFWC